VLPSVATRTPATTRAHVASAKPARARARFMKQRVRPDGGAVAAGDLRRVNRYHDV
jgi:hypothetical protein